MEAGILCQILAGKIDPSLWCLHGLEVFWYDESNNTAENQAIIDDVTTNYETYALPFVKAEQIKLIKNQMRILLAMAIGDYGDNLADITRAMVLAEGIRNGSITDQNIIDGYAQYCAALVQMYGGAQSILDVLNFDLQGLQTYLAPYYNDASDVNSSTSVTDATNIGTTVVNTKITP
jgi:hypothetical protein